MGFLDFARYLSNMEMNPQAKKDSPLLFFVECFGSIDQSITASYLN